MSPASHARQAVAYTRAQLGELPSNHIVTRITTLGGSTACVARMRTLPDHRVGTVRGIRQVAADAKAARCGNCGEYAAVAFDFLMLGGCPHAVEYAEYVSPGDHAFVIVGRPSDTDPANPSTWGRDAVVCDAWAGEVVFAASYWTGMPRFPSAVHAPRVLVRCELGDFPITNTRTRAA